MKFEEARRILLVGAGSHGRVVLDLLRDLGVESRVAGFLDAVHSRTGEVEGVPLLGGPDDIEQLAPSSIRFCCRSEMEFSGSSGLKLCVRRGFLC